MSRRNIPAAAVFSLTLSSRPLDSAAWTGRTEGVRFLLERGADVNAKEKSAGRP